MTRRSRERAKWQKEGRIRWGGGTEWRSRVTSRPRVHGLRCQWLKRTWKKKKKNNFKGNCYEILLDRGDAKFLPHLPMASSVQLVFLMTLL